MNDQQPEVLEESAVLEDARESFSADELLGSDLSTESAAEAITMEDAKLKAVLEAIIYVTDEPLSLEQICIAIEQSRLHFNAERASDVPAGVLNHQTNRG